MDLGYYLLFFSLLFGIYSVYSFLRALRGNTPKFAEYGEKFVYIYSFFIISAFLLLLYYFLIRDFNVAYVYLYSDSKLSLGYTISAVWAGKEGSLLLWAVFLSLLNLILLRFERRDKVLASVLTISTFIFSFFVFMLLLSNPFERLNYFPKDGYGLNPLLRTLEMAIHPPLIFLGYACVTFPFAFSIASLYYKKEWEGRARIWIIISWIFLTIGIILGAVWSYKTLGWGGYWAWDPVENSSLIPWLMLTALIHGIISKFRKLNYLLAYFSFASVIFATYVTRSGIIESVHAFGKNFEATPYLLLILFSGVIALLVYLKSDFSDNFKLKERDYAILIEAILLALFAIPLISGLLSPIIFKASLTKEFYNSVESPLALALAILSGICIAFGGKFKRNILISIAFGIFIFSTIQILTNMIYVSLFSAIAAFSILNHALKFRLRSLGSFLVHMGFLIILIGVAGSWVYEEHYSVKLDDKVKLNTRFGNVEFDLIKVERVKKLEKEEIIVYIQLYENGKAKAILKPAVDVYNLQRQDRVIYRVSILSDILKDYYVVAYPNKGIFAEIYIEPLVSLIWLGSGLMIIGGILALRKLY